MIRASHTTVVAACIAAIELGSDPAHAQFMRPGGSSAPPSAPASAPAQTRDQAVVVVAMTGHGYVDEYLRITADELKGRLRDHGFRDVDQAVLRDALAPHQNVATLRNRLGLGCVIRVDVLAFDSSEVSLLVLVQTTHGEQAVTVRSALADVFSKAVEAADPLIPAPWSTRQPSPLSPNPFGQYSLPDDDRVVLHDGTVLHGTVLGLAGARALTMRMRDGVMRTISWYQIRQIVRGVGDDMDNNAWEASTGMPHPADWSSRGGSRFFMDVQLQLVGVLARHDHVYEAAFPGGHLTFTGDGLTGGGGGTIGFHAGLLQLGIPNPSNGSTIWAFKLGTGADLGAAAYVRRAGDTITADMINDGTLIEELRDSGIVNTSVATVVMLPFTIGGQVGFGSFRNDIWRGVMLGANWHPTYTYINPGGSETLGSFNYLGVQAQMEIVSITANANRSESNFQLSFTYLPKIDRNATYISIGFGAVWY